MFIFGCFSCLVLLFLLSTIRHRLPPSILAHPHPVPYRYLLLTQSNLGPDPPPPVPGSGVEFGLDSTGVHGIQGQGRPSDYPDPGTGRGGNPQSITGGSRRPNPGLCPRRTGKPDGHLSLTSVTNWYDGRSRGRLVSSNRGLSDSRTSSACLCRRNRWSTGRAGRSQSCWVYSGDFPWPTGP